MNPLKREREESQQFFPSKKPHLELTTHVDVEPTKWGDFRGVPKEVITHIFSFCPRGDFLALSLINSPYAKEAKRRSERF